MDTETISQNLTDTVTISLNLMDTTALKLIMNTVTIALNLDTVTVVMMILTDLRKGIWIVPGVSHENCNENQFTSQPILSGCQFTEPK